MRKGSHLTDEQQARLSAAALKANVGRAMPESTRLAIRKALLGHPVSEATRSALREANKGRVPPNKGIPMTEEQKEVVAAAHRGLPSPNKGKPLSKATRELLSAAHIGKPTWNKGQPWTDEHKVALSCGDQHCALSDWNGYLTPINKTIRASTKYAKWRLAVFERDNYTCQECRARSCKGHKVILEAHHTHEFAQYPDERFVVENGKTLCLECHNKTKGRRAQVAT